MEIRLTEEQIRALWIAAYNARDDEGGCYGRGAYDVLQSLTGHLGVDIVLEKLNIERTSR